MIGKKGLNLVCNGMKHLKKLMVLDLHDNYFNSDKCGRMLAKGLKYTCKLISINLEDCMLGNNDSKEIIWGISRFCPFMACVNLSHNFIDHTKVEKAVLKLLKTHSYIQVKDI